MTGDCGLHWVSSGCDVGLGGVGLGGYSNKGCYN